MYYICNTLCKNQIQESHDIANGILFNSMIWMLYKLKTEIITVFTPIIIN